MSRGPEFIIIEKDNAAGRIADILSGKTASAERMNGMNVCKWGGKRCVELLGHVVSVGSPPEYNGWCDVEPVELTGTPVEKHLTQENIVAAPRCPTHRTGKVTTVTDYDHEGELIGKEAYGPAHDANEDVPIDRVWFSSITNREVMEAFENPNDLDSNLTAASEVRQIANLVWETAFTRFLSLSTHRLGNDFTSVGRVQGPTLELIVDREREIGVLDPEDYWEPFSKLTKDADSDAESFRTQYFCLDDGGTEAGCIWDEDDTEEAYQTLLGVEAAEVSLADRRTRTDTPPAPLNTTQFIRAAGSIGYSAQRVMSVVKDFYTAGYITHPRTDNTVYPGNLDPYELLGTFEGDRQFKEDAESLLEQEEIEPTEGDSETTDHPSTHPIGELPSASGPSDDGWDVYELVIRRFFTTIAKDAVWGHLHTIAEVEGPSLKANDRRLSKAGYHGAHPYFNSSELFVPDVGGGESFVLSDTRLDTKQTQPPRRYGQSRFIEMTEQMGIGTEATRHDVIQKLYNHGYIESDPPQPTHLVRAVVEVSEDFARLIVSEEMTSQFESDVLTVAHGEATLEDATGESKEMLGEMFGGLMESHEELDKQLQDSLKADRMAGTCPDYGGDLVVRKSRRGSYFIGCDSYPDCTYTLPLPSTGKPLIMEESCEGRDLHHIKMPAGRRTLVHGCPFRRAEEADEEDDLVIGAYPECGEEHDDRLVVKRLRFDPRLVGCTRYPNCSYSLPLPRHDDIEVTDESCGEHDLPELRIMYEGDREPRELGCPICNYREYQAQQNGEGGSELENISGTGTKTAEKLKDAGTEDVRTLKASEPDDIATKVEGAGTDTVRKWQIAAD